MARGCKGPTRRKPRNLNFPNHRRSSKWIYADARESIDQCMSSPASSWLETRPCFHDLFKWWRRHQLAMTNLNLDCASTIRLPAVWEGLLRVQVFHLSFVCFRESTRDTQTRCNSMSTRVSTATVSYWTSPFSNSWLAWPHSFVDPPETPVIRHRPVIKNFQRIPKVTYMEITLSFLNAHILHFGFTHLQCLPARFVSPLPMDKQAALPQNFSFPTLNSPTNSPHLRYWRWILTSAMNWKRWEGIKFTLFRILQMRRNFSRRWRRKIAIRCF